MSAYFQNRCVLLSLEWIQLTGIKCDGVFTTTHVPPYENGFTKERMCVIFKTSYKGGRRWSSRSMLNNNQQGQVDMGEEGYKKRPSE